MYSSPHGDSTPGNRNTLAKPVREPKNSQTKQSREKKTKERSTVNLYFPELLRIDFGKDEVDVPKFLNDRYKATTDDLRKNLTQKQADRKIEHLKRVFLNNYLMDLSEQNDVAIFSKTTKKKEEQIERFTLVEIKGFVYNQEDIVEMGVEINKLIMGMQGSKATFTVKKKELFDLFNPESDS
ncbi:Uncharacterized protein QTN25_008953 [Entamoeba marina]